MKEEEITMLEEMLDNCLNKNDYVDDKRLKKAMALQGALDLNKRVDKAIEFIEENKAEKAYTDRSGFKVYTGTYFVEYAEDLLSLLKGEKRK